MAKTFYTLADLNTGDVLPETYLDENNANHANLIVPPMAWVVSGTSWSIGNGTAVAIGFTTSLYDTDGMWTSGDPTVLTVNTDGIYLVSGCVRFAANSTGQRRVRILRGTIVVGSQASDAAASGATEFNVSAAFPAAAGDEFALEAFQNSGGALTVELGATYSPVLSATWLGRTTAP